MGKDDDNPIIRGVIFGVGSDFAVDPEGLAAAMVDFGPGLDEMIDNAVAGAKEWKEGIVANGPEDIPDQCVAVMPQGVFYCPIQMMCDGIGVRPPEAMAIALGGLAASFGKPIAVLSLIETIGQKITDPDQLAEHTLGEFAERWHAGDRENLFESITICVATLTTFTVVHMPYHYGDGSVVWDEQRRDDEEGWLDKDIAENMKAALAVAFTIRQQEGEGDGTG